MERRSFVRVPLDVLLFARMEVEGRPPYKGTIVDVSKGGIQLALPAPPENALLGTEVIVSGLPTILDPTGVGCDGTVCWVAALRCGIQFFHPLPLSDEELEAIFS